MDKNIFEIIKRPLAATYVTRAADPIERIIRTEHNTALLSTTQQLPYTTTPVGDELLDREHISDDEGPDVINHETAECDDHYGPSVCHSHLCQKLQKQEDGRRRMWSGLLQESLKTSKSYDCNNLNKQ